MRTARLLLTAALLVAVPATPSAAAPTTPRSAIGATHVWTHRLAPQLASDAKGDELLVMGVPDGHGGLSKIVATSRSVGGEWGAEQTLVGPHPGLNAPTLVMSPRGTAVLAWSQGFDNPLRVRVRDAKGTWGPTRVLPRLRVYGTPQVLVNARGDIAVADDADSGTSQLAVRRNGVWTITKCPGYSTPIIGQDRAGVVYAVTVSVDHGGLGDPYEHRLGLDGRWSDARRIDGVSAMTLDAQVLVSPAGHLTIALGYVSKHWKSTYDGDDYFSTAYVVLRQRTWADKPQVAWRRDGADWMEMDATGRGGLRLTWTQWAAAVKRKPTRIALKVQQLGEPAVKLASQPARWVHGSYDAETVVGPRRRAFTWWRAFPANGPESRLLRLAETTPNGAGATGTAAGTVVRDSDLTRSSVLGSGALAWTSGVTYRNTRAYGWLERDGSVAVGGETP